MPIVRWWTRFITWPILVLILLLLRSLWVRLLPPEGSALKREQAPQLFQTVNHLRRALKGPSVHCLQLTDEFNASISQVPRLGLLGWQRNYLSIGLPLMLALSLEQFCAVLAHEFGHLSGAHGRFGGWIYRIRRTWYQVMEALTQKRHAGAFVFKRFFEWYAPYFSAYSFVLARHQEYEADRCAVQIAGARQTADMLINLNVYGKVLSDKFWPAMTDAALERTTGSGPTLVGSGLACPNQYSRHASFLVRSPSRTQRRAGPARAN